MPHQWVRGVSVPRSVVTEWVPLLGERERLTLVPHGTQSTHVSGSKTHICLFLTANLRHINSLRLRTAQKTLKGLKNVFYMEC